MGLAACGLHQCRSERFKSTFIVVAVSTCALPSVVKSGIKPNTIRTIRWCVVLV